MTHTGTQIAMSLVSGLMLGVAFFHLLPHSVVLLNDRGAVDFSVTWLMAGLIAMLLLLRLFHFHQHDFSHEHGGAHDSHHPHDDNGSVHSLSWAGIALGLGLHTLIDGVALGAVMHGSSSSGGFLGIGVFLAILLHKPLDAMSIVTVMRAGGWSIGAQRVANLSFALLCPLGALLFYFGVDLATESSRIVAASLAFAAGTFICIALSDLLPEVHFHSHDRTKLTLAFLLGIALAYAMGSVEPPGLHGHGADSPGLHSTEVFRGGRGLAVASPAEVAVAGLQLSTPIVHDSPVTEWSLS
ncbi:MAG: ZIP family metal transporter [Halioglobus sp.]|nr:ZIP family metal transporter [Halioglobus sp.]